MEILAKKRKLEECPYGKLCCSRIPIHFNEYYHAHLESYVGKGESIEFPANFTQQNLIEEQSTTSISSETLENVSQSPSAIGEISNKLETKSPITGHDETASVESSIGDSDVKVEKLTMIRRMERTKPYNLFFNVIPEAKQTHTPDNCISFSDLLCPSLGRLTNSLQINFLIDIKWLMEQYQVHNLCDVPLTILYGHEYPDMQNYINTNLPNVKYKKVKMESLYGTHHSKLGIYAYDDDSIRIVVSTANLYDHDWDWYNQGLWVSPTLPKLPDCSPDSSCSGITNFKGGLLKYLNSYKYGVLQEWLEKVKRADFSSVRVHFIASFPGKYSDTANEVGCHLHQVGSILNRQCNIPEEISSPGVGPSSWSIFAHASSIGSLGTFDSDWLLSDIVSSLGRHTKDLLPHLSRAGFSFVYPTYKNVINSHFGVEGGGCLPYTKKVHNTQLWLREYLHRWKADCTGRSRAMPHIKTYYRISPCMSKLAYFLLTSANLSKAAWGTSLRQTSYVRSYEVGVLFIPSLFDEDFFKIRGGNDEKPLFPFMYDLPLEPYEDDDRPWLS